MTERAEATEAAPPSGKLRVLAVDDDVAVGNALGRTLRYADISVEVVSDPAAGLARALEGDFDAVLLDILMPGTTGLEILGRLRDAGVASSVVMLTSDASAATAAECFRGGAFHYLTKPVRHVELLAVLEAASRHTQLRRRVQKLERAATNSALDHLIVGDDPSMRKVQAALQRLGRVDVSVLIQGESGTGKELAARALHELSDRRDRPFVAVNCAAIPETLIDSELFGHSKGAFTGADAHHPGLFMQAHRGTIFLDEIGDMPLAVQARLLRVLQEGEIRPIGGQGVHAVDVRVVAATNVDLQRAVEERQFRQDLFYRFNVVTLWLPPLRERLIDLPLLAGHFLRKHGGEASPDLTPAALDALLAYGWPGNVRELENAVLHALALRSGERIDLDALPGSVRTARGGVAATGSGEIPRIDEDDPPLADAKRAAITEFERGYLVRALTRAHGSVSEAARRAGLDRTNFRRLLHRYDIDPAGFRR